MRRRGPNGAIAVASVLLVVGCGASGTHGPSRAHYIAHAEAICAQTQQRTSPLITRISGNLTSLLTGGASGARQIAPTVSTLHAVATSELARLRALAQPDGGHAAIEAFLGPLGSVVSALGKAADALHAGQSPQALSLLQNAQPLVGQVTSSAHAYGLAKCESVLSALG